MKTITRVITIIALFAISAPAFAQVVEPLGKNKVANGGYDVVAYFTDNAAVKGEAAYTTNIKGVKYQFANAEHQNLFKQHPEKYLPQCDGYCAWGVAEKGKKVPVNPETFKVIDGKLYLFFNGDFNGNPFNTLPEWNKNEKMLLSNLPGKWAKLQKS